MSRRRCPLLALLLVSFCGALLTAADRPATILLITDAELAPAWQTFEHWKTRLGKSTQLITTQEIILRYPGEDLPARIKAAVHDHINTRQTRWVILGGDSSPDGGRVPDRDTVHRMFGYKDLPTDSYYISTDSWDSNGDGLYGDWPNDAKDCSYTHPKACIGRIPVRSAADITAYTDKVIAYESTFPAKTFATQFLYTCPVPGAYPKLGTSKKTIAQVWQHGRIDQLFANASSIDQATDQRLSPETWRTHMNAGHYSKWHIHGHGLLDRWILGKKEHQSIDTRNLQKLTNTNAYPIITTVSCFTGEFDSRKDPSIAEAMLRAPGAGAIAVLAPSREGVPVFARESDLQLMVTQGKMDGTTESYTNFWSEGLAADKSIGEAFSAAKDKMSERARAHPGYHWCQCELNLLGDPSLPMRALPPDTITPEVPKLVQAGQQTLTIRCDRPDLTVCVWQQGQVYAIGETVGPGHCQLQINPAKGTLLITVSGTTINAWQGQIQVN